MTSMTREEFILGWNLLVAQPWGRRYATVTDKSSAVTAATQLEFYFRKLCTYEGTFWRVTCESFAAGDHWPSVDELRTSMNFNLPQRMRLEYNTEQSEMPEPIALAMAYATAHHVTVLEGIQKVFPEWIKTHDKDDPVVFEAELLLKQFRFKKPSGFINATAAYTSRMV